MHTYRFVISARGSALLKEGTVEARSLTSAVAQMVLHVEPSLEEDARAIVIRRLEQGPNILADDGLELWSMPIYADHRKSGPNRKTSLGEFLVDADVSIDDACEISASLVRRGTALWEGWTLRSVASIEKRTQLERER